ncbi:MAG: CBS domain-containing protein [Nitrincola sp.]|nr:CBS domain-containing protein [Nitrincola sp.]
MALLIYNNGIITPTSSVLAKQRHVEELQQSSPDRQTENPAPLARAAVPLGRKYQSSHPSNLYLDTERKSDTLQERRKLQAMHIMSSPVVSIPSQGTIFRALALMDQAEVDHLVVVDEDFKPVRLLHRNRLEQARSSELILITQMVPEEFSAVTGDTLVRDIAQFFITHKLTAMPVVDQDSKLLIGIICRPDLMRLLVSGPNVKLEV